MSREFKIGERLQIWDSAQRCYKQGVTVKRVIPDEKGVGADIVVVYDKPILGVRPRQTFRPGVLEERIVRED
jgi:hypothetical protein